MKCTNCGQERLKNVTRQGETCSCKTCGAEFTARTSADAGRPAVIYCSRVPLSRGGKREGAGRKPRPDERKVPLAIKLAVDLSEYLATVESKTGAIEDALRRSRGFREWKKTRGG